MTWLPLLGVASAGVYLLALGLASLIQPDRTRRFLHGFASSPRAHFTELFLRLVLGVSFIVRAPAMTYSTAFEGFGWVLVATTLVLLALPWQWHHRFASWSVPLATRNMTLFAVGPLLGAIVVLWSLRG